MYIEHPFFYDNKYFAKVDGNMVEISKEVAYAMNNFCRSSKPRKIEVVDEEQMIVKKLREIPYSEGSSEDAFSIEDYPDLLCDVEGSVMDCIEREEVHQAINKLDEEERMIIYEIYFENKTQMEVAKIMGISQPMLVYKLKKILSKMRGMFR